MYDTAIINYGMGNINSVANALTRLGTSYIIADNPQDLAKARRIILPGVGSFAPAMENLYSSGFQDELNNQVILDKKPFLGICLGMQLIAESSSEDKYTKGLGWIKGNVIKIEPLDSLVVPHVGWNELNFDPQCIFFQNISPGAHFFFDHSYHLSCPPELISATCNYSLTLISAVQLKNIFAVQFHPEKSQNNGLKLIKNFLKYVDDGLS